MARRRNLDEVTAPLLAEEGKSPAAKKDKRTKDPARYEPGEDWDPDLPYGGRVYLPRKKKDDPLYVRLIEAGVLVFTALFALYAYFYFDRLHFHVTHGYAHMGFPSAQHQVGQRYLHGVGIEKDPHTGMEWFKKAADQGHPHASYNLAVGHLKGLRRDLLQKGEPHRLIEHAASNGVKEARKVLNDVCSRPGGCE